MVKLIKTGIAAAVVALGLAGTASAGDYGHGQGYGFAWKKVVNYQTVMHYVDKHEAYTDYVTEYDHCYKPYQKAITKYRTIQVPVYKQVPVVSWVKVPAHNGGGYNGGGY